MVMYLRILRQISLVLYFLLSYNGVQGRTNFSKLEELALEEQLKLLNKASIKTIKSKSGDIYNCMNFYKQPAFDHPSLKDHNFHPEMKPTLAGSNQNSSTTATNWSPRIWSKDDGCPFGTVPIKEITKEDLIRQKNIPPPESATYKSELITTNNRRESNGYKLAIVKILKNPNKKVAGAGMSASLYNPHVKGQQHSGCRMKVQKGSDILQVGWRVDPTLYRDTKTRLFVHFQAGNTHCFNTLCPGFVQVNNKIPVDMAFNEVSRRGDKISQEIRMNIDRELVNGNWWLILGKSNIQVGFWPQNIFTSLRSFATKVEWGGVAYSPPGVPEPPMGSSFFPIKRTAYDAYCRKLIVVNEKGETIDVDKTTIYVDDPNLYRVSDYPQHDQHFVFYGGPGEIRKV